MANHREERPGLNRSSPTFTRRLVHPLARAWMRLRHACSCGPVSKPVRWSEISFALHLTNPIYGDIV